MPRAWTPPTGVLAELVAAAELRAAALGARPRDGSAPPAVPRFVAALRGRSVVVIAELKRRSPSKGAINVTLQVGSRAAEYAAGGAGAVSVLTEPDRFGGSLDDLREVRGAIGLPVLRKDFIVSPAQLREARLAGASAVLLIARALEPARFDALAAEATAMGLDLLLEVRDEAELARALAVPHGAIGVNTRNLETLAIDPSVGARLLPLVPRDRIAVYESGIATRADVERAASHGADAVLVGSSLSGAPDGTVAVRALVGVPAMRRG